MKIGDHVDYKPIHTRHSPVKDCIITQLEAKGAIFNTDMAVVDKIDHWVCQSELTLVEEG